MPTYTFENTKTGKVFDDFMSMADKETYLEQNPHIKQIINKINIDFKIIDLHLDILN